MDLAEAPPPDLLREIVELLPVRELDMAVEFLDFLRERRIQGLLPSGGEFNPEARAWNLGESELAIAANIDPHFRGTFLAAISPANGIHRHVALIASLRQRGFQ